MTYGNWSRLNDNDGTRHPADESSGLMELARARTSMGADVLCASFAVATHPQHQFEHHVHHAHDDAADDGPAQPVDLQSPVRQRRGDHQHDAVDHKHEQPQREEHERARQLSQIYSPYI